MRSEGQNNLIYAGLGVAHAQRVNGHKLQANSFKHSKTKRSMAQVPDEPNIGASNFGESEITALVAAFYRMARKDDLIGPMYPQDDWEGSEQRLRDFLIYRFGGSDRYIKERGHPRLKMRHAPFKIGIPQRDRWLKLMKQAMEEAKIPNTETLNMKVFFDQVAEFLRND